jgi:hypothetical protein
MFKPTSPENAAVIARIETALAAVSLGQTVSYAELSKVAKRDLQNGSRWLLTRAIEHTEKSLGCAFEAVRGVGIRRLPSDEIPNVGLASLRRIRSTARRGKKRIDRANTNSLSEADKRRVVGFGAMLGAVSLIADGRKASAIAAVADPVKPIPPENILDMFRRAE